MFISAVGYHESTNEFFVPVYYIADSVDETFFEDMALEHDSVIVKEEEITRTRLNPEVARKNFNLVGLEKILIFNKKGEQVGEATFERVEYLDEMIEGKYTAVFKPTSKIDYEDMMYCISAGRTAFTEQKWNWEKITDKRLDDQLKRKFDLDQHAVARITHVQIPELDVIYSSTPTFASWTSRLMETKNGFAQSLMELPENWSLDFLQPIHFSYNGKPVFLSGMMLEESDGYFQVLLAFDGEKYVVLEGDRSR